MRLPLARVGLPCAALFAVLLGARSADAADAPSSAPTPPASADASSAATPARPRHRWVGAELDVGAPDGAAVGLVVRPVVEWLRLGVAYTYNSAASGVRAGATLDPIHFPVAPTLTIEGGRAFDGTVSWLGGSTAPTVGYSYANVHLGLELGDRNSWRIYLHGGLSAITGQARNVPIGGGSSSTTDANVNLLALGTAKLGFTLYF